MKKFIQKYALAIVAVVTIVTFSAFRTSGVTPLLPMTVAIYFQGDPMVPAEVTDESLWTTATNGETCNQVNQKACMQHVEDTDLTSGVLNSAKISLGSFDSGAGFIPTRIGGSSSTPFTPFNRS